MCPEEKRERERESFKWPFGIYFESNQNHFRILECTMRLWDTVSIP